MTRSYHPDIGTFISEQDCKAPVASIIKTIKVCETCGTLFSRPCAPMRPVIVKGLKFNEETGEDEPTACIVYVDTGERYCGSCKSRMLLPPNQDDYREQIPKIGPNDCVHLPHYDNSLLPKRETRPRLSTRGIHRDDAIL